MPHPHELPVLRSERIIIRPLELGDLDDCCRLYSDIGWHVQGLSEKEERDRRESWLAWTIAGYTEFARLMQPPYGERAITTVDDGRFVGLIGVVPCLAPFDQLKSGDMSSAGKRSADVGLFWALLQREQGKGFASEAAGLLTQYLFERLELKRIVALTDESNVSSINVMKRLGMRIETNPSSEPEWFQIAGISDAPTMRIADPVHPLRDRIMDEQDKLP